PSLIPQPCSYLSIAPFTFFHFLPTLTLACPIFLFLDISQFSDQFLSSDPLTNLHFSCIRCPNSTATTSEGMSLESACLPVDCHLLHCQNQAGCSVKNHKPVCNCKPGWIGDRCEVIY